jgi:hypothetical protein
MVDPNLAGPEAFEELMIRGKISVDLTTLARCGKNGFPRSVY